MKKLIYFCLVVFVIFSLTGCGGSGRVRTPVRAFEPDWWRLQDNSEYVYTFGQSEKVSRNASETAAYADAMQEAAQYVESHVQSMIRNYIEEAGVENPQVLALTSSVTRVVSNAKFSGTMISKSETYTTDNRYQTFVRVSIPVSEINRTLHNQIKNEEALYNQFKASQAFQDMDDFFERQ